MQTIGESTHARVKLAKNMEDDKYYAVKIIKIRSRKSQIENFLTEVSLLSECEH